jgi:hypothetical protein
VGHRSDFLRSEDFIIDTHATPLSVRRSSTTITSVRLMNQSNLVASRDRIFLRTLRLAMESSVTSMLQGCLDQFLRERVSADEIFGNDRS